MVNTKCDTSYYDSRGYQRKIFDGNVLYESKAKAMKGSDWKPQVQRFKVKVNDLSERVVMVEQSTKSAHHRLDRYEEEEIYHGKPRKRWWV